MGEERSPKEKAFQLSLDVFGKADTEIIKTILSLKY